jgi:periplasmic divalent cation tolerance protein
MNERLTRVQANDKAVLIYTTFPDAAAAETVGGSLVDRGLAACVNVIPGMTSIYVWQGSRHRDSEVVMIVKTRASLAERVIEEARKQHPYDNPALVVLPIEGGSTDFLSWILLQTEKPL